MKHSPDTTVVKVCTSAPLLRICLFCIMLQLNGCSFLWSSDPTRYVNYTVKPGDTIYTLGLKYNVTTDAIIDANDIDDPRQLQVGTVLKVPYEGSASRGKSSPPPPALIHQRDPGSVQTVKLTGAHRYVGKLLWPIRGGTISSRFGTRWFNFHEGIDIRAIERTPIYAAQDGRVVYSGDGLRGYGNLIVIQGDGLATIYGHNDENIVEVGDTVRRGDKIGYVGQTGKATAPHLHFETRIKNQESKLVAVDPLVFFPGEV